jgi:cytochrome c oxidase subunit 3
MSAHGAADHDDHHFRLHPSDVPEDAHFGVATPGKVGMWIFLLTDALMFAGFLLAYGILRGGSKNWICTEAVSATTGCIIEPELGINFTAGLTFLLICSSVTMVLAFAAAQENDRKGLCKYLAFTIIGGALFLCGQYYEYFGLFGIHGLIAEGLIFGQSAYATTFYLITSFHGAHVFSGVVYLSIILIRAMRGAFDDGFTSEVELVGLFWHFVDLVWILVFTLVYLIPE